MASRKSYRLLILKVMLKVTGMDFVVDLVVINIFLTKFMYT